MIQTRVFFFFTAPKVAGKPKGDSKSPKKKKKNVWSESEGSGDNDISDDNLDASYLESVIPRERGPRRQAGRRHSLARFFPTLDPLDGFVYQQVMLASLKYFPHQMWRIF